MSDDIPRRTTSVTNNRASGSRITQSFRDQKQLESFIRSKKLLKIVESAAEQYVNRFQETNRHEDASAAIFVQLPFKYADFLNWPLELLHLALEEPVQFADATKYCVFGIVRDFVKQRTAETGLRGVDIEQVHLQLRFFGLPLQADLKFEPAEGLYPCGLSFVDGVLSELTEPEQVVLQTVWYCTTGCPRNKIKAESVEPPNCNSCSRQMSEYSKLRLTQQTQLLRLLPLGTVQTPHTELKVFRALTVAFKGGELVNTRLRRRASTWCPLLHLWVLRLSRRRPAISSMEHSPTHDSTLAVLGNISQDELDDLLSLDNTPLAYSLSGTTAAVDIMQQNAQQLPSQIDGTQSPCRLGSTDDFNVTMSQSASNIEHSSHIASAATLITISDSPLPDLHFDADVKEEVCLDLAAASAAQDKSFAGDFSMAQADDFELPPLDIDFENLNAVERAHSTSGRINHHEMDTSTAKPFPQIGTTMASASLLHFDVNVKHEVDTDKDKTFAHEFSRVQADDFELPPIDIDFEHLDALEREHSTSGRINHHEMATSRAKLFTQIATTKAPIDHHDISASCPLPVHTSHRLQRLTAPAHTNIDQSNALSLLALEYKKSTQAPKERSGVVHPQPIGLYRPVSRVNDAPSELELSLLQTTGRRAQVPSAHSKAQFATDVNSSMADATNVPLSVKRLYDIVRKEHSDFAFVYALSAQLCQDRVPMDCFVSLKIGLLLSLASIANTAERPPIPIIAIGTESNMTNYLMTTIAQFAERFVGPADDFKTSRSSEPDQHKWIVADPVQLAMGGVYYVGDWTGLKVARSEKLFKDIERSQVTIENTARVYPLQTAIWGHWCSYKHNAKDQLSFVKFVNIFGIPIYIGDDKHELLVDYLLEQYSTDVFEPTVDNLSITYEDMKSFISCIAKRTVDLTHAATTLLEQYFVAARVEHPDLTRQAFVILKQFAESFAKLAFRHEVVPLDVIGAIFMCEHSMQNIFGASHHPPPKFESPNFVGEVDKQLARFQEWLQGFIAKDFQE